MEKFKSIYSIIVGISVISMWMMLIFTGQIKEGAVEITFHLVSEFLMAILLIISGVGLLKNKKFGKKLFLLASGMLIYSVLNAAGYYGQSGDVAMIIMFVILFIITSTILVIDFLHKCKEYN